MGADTTNTNLQDHELAEAARRGRRPAFDELHRRHGGTSWRLAMAVTREPSAAAAAIQAGWATALSARPSSSVVEQDVRASLLRATRHAAVDVDHTRVAPAPEVLDLDGGDPAAVVTKAAFASLPERWRSTIWLLDVERLALDDVARALELAPEAVASLADRARLGLREQLLHRAVSPTEPLPCRRTAERLSGYADGSLPEADEARVRGHLDGCATCRGRLAMLDDAVPVLRAAALPMPVALGDDAAGAWSAALVRQAGPLRLTLPGGRPIPTWAQRSIAGAVGAVVALGVAGATLLAGGRGSRVADDQATSAAAAVGAADGESALGGLGDLRLDGEGFVPPSFGAAAGPSAGSGSSLDELSRTGGAPLPRSTSASATPLPGSAPLPTTPGGPTGPSTPPPPPPPPPGPSDDGSLTAGIGGVVTVTVGEDCTGAEVLGTAIGCEPEATDEPVTLPTLPLPTTDPVAPLATSLGL